MGKWFRTGQVAERVGRTREWVRRECELGQTFPGARFARQWRIPAEDLQAYEALVERATARVVRRRRPRSD